MTATIASLNASFARDLRAEGASDSTVYKYRASVDQYAAWLVTEGQPTTLDNLTRPNIRQWLGYLSDEGRMPNTVMLRKAGLSRFCGWLLTEGEIGSNPMALGIKTPKADIKPVPVFSQDQLRALIKACAGNKWSDRRDEALIRMLIDTGVRANELMTMTLDNLELDDRASGGMVLVHGKYNKKRVVYFGAKTARAVDRYLRTRSRHRAAHSQRLWLSERGEMGLFGIDHVLKQRGAAAGVSPIRPHMFRHTYAASWLIAGGNETDLMRLAGWADRDMLQRYGLAAADARAQVAARRIGIGDRV